MIRLAADEDLNGDIIRGVLRRDPGIDFRRVLDAGLSGASDADVLSWAASDGRVLLTHDVSTMTAHAYARIASGLPMPGVFEIGQHVPVAVAIEEVLMLAQCSIEGEWEGQVRYIPL